MASTKLDVILTLVDQFSTASKEVASKAEAMSEKFSKAGKALAPFSAAATAASIAGLKFADAWLASIDKVEMVFGDAANIVFDFTDDASRALRASREDANEYAGVWGMLFQQLGKDATEAAKMTNAQLLSIADAASANNVAFSDMNDSVQSALAGSNISLRRFGLFLTAAQVETKAFEMGLAESIDALTEHDKWLARNALILEHFDQWSGDAARTSGELNAMYRIQISELKNLAAEYGVKLIPIGTKVLQLTGKLIDFAFNLSDKWKTVIATVTALTAASTPFLLILSKIIGAKATLMLVAKPLIAVLVALKSAALLPLIAIGGIFVGVLLSAKHGVEQLIAIIQGKKSVMDAWKDTWNSITSAIGNFINWIKQAIDWISKIKIPAILTGKSPSPFENSLMGINDALREMSKIKMDLLGNVGLGSYRFATAPAPVAVRSGDTNYHLHINTSAPYEPMIDDFDSMKAMKRG